MCSIVHGDRPTKPKNATKIGLSDLLWGLLQACWDGDRSKRPRMQYVENQIRNAAVRWERQAPRRRPLPLSLRPGDIPPNSNPLVAFSRSSSTGTRNSSGSDQSLLNIPIIKIDVVGSEDNCPHSMQEFYPPPSPISLSQSGSFLNEAIINRLDGVSPQLIRFDSKLDAGFRFWNEGPSLSKNEQEY